MMSQIVFCSMLIWSVYRYVTESRKRRIVLRCLVSFMCLFFYLNVV
jgi:hypothetical protein